MKKQSLDKKIEKYEDFDFLLAEDVKETLQTIQRRIEEVIDNFCGKYAITKPELELEINKIFKEEVGELI